MISHLASYCTTIFFSPIQTGVTQQKNIEGGFSGRQWTIPFNTILRSSNRNMTILQRDGPIRG